MKIEPQENWMKQRHSVTVSPQFWGIVSLNQRHNGFKESFAAAVHSLSDIDWVTGSTWCLIFENARRGDIITRSSCSKKGLHVGVAGKVWSLNNEKQKNAELVADLYQSYGNGIINQCDGQFAAVIIDEQENRTVLTINWPGGFHRLYYCTDGQSLAFATRLDLLVHRCGWKAQVNEQAIVDLLRFGGLMSEVTLLESVSRVVPGFAVLFEKGKVTQHIVYEYPNQENNDHSDSEEMLRLHSESIQKRISDYNDFGLFLSGGLDSGMNVAIAAELSSKPVKTFNVAFDANEFDESPYARLVASKYNTEHFELCLDTADCLERLPEMVWALQEPISDYSYIPTFYVAEAIKQHVEVAIGGDGPDHLLGRNYQFAAWYDLLQRVPFAYKMANRSVNVDQNSGKIKSSFWKYARRKRLGRQFWQSLACVSNPCGSGMLNSFCNVLWGDLPPNDLVRLITPDLLRRTDISPQNQSWIKRWQEHKITDSLTNFILADTTLSGLCGVFTKVGTMCSVFNLTIHEPYLATPLIQYFCGLKNNWKVDGSLSKQLRRKILTSQTKRILRQAATDYLPKEIVLQKQKHGFELPLLQCWQQSTSGFSSSQIYHTILNNTDWFDKAFLNKMVQEQALGKRNHRYILLLLAALDQWFRIFVHNNAKPPDWRWSQSFGL